MVRLLVIDGDGESARLLEALLLDGFAVFRHQQAALAVDAVRRWDPDVVFLAADLQKPGADTVLAAVTELPVAPPVVLVAPRTNPSIVAKTVRSGAFSYITKPYRRGEVLEVIDEALSETAYRRASTASVHHPAVRAIVGETPEMLRLKQQVERYAHSDSPILIEGESGTGKDLVARAIHELSERTGGPFIAVNCGAIPLSLFESEMFGSVRGAYTGAVTRPGCFEQANYGTLFLDEIGDMDVHAQVKLLRVLEEGHVTRVGGVRPLPIDTRTIAATNTDLRSAMEDKAFRGDLFYRLNVLGLRIPALRDRKEDVPLLVDHFLREHKPVRSMSTSAIRKLLLHTWPGNVRELRNVVNRAAFLAEGRRITAADVILV